MFAASTGNGSERVKTIPITRRSQAHPVSVMSLSPGRLPALRRGDRLRVSAEVQVSTTCVDNSARCVGRPYGFSPNVGARLVLARGAAATGGGAAEALSGRSTLQCSQRRPNRNHHCVLVFGGVEKRIRNLGRLPCRPGDCHVNLVVDAHDRQARSGNLLEIGADRPNGEVIGDKGRVDAVLFRSGPKPESHTSRTRDRVHASIPIGSERSGGDRVVYSVRLPHLRRNDVLVAEARQTTSIGALPYSAFISSQLTLTEGREKPNPGRFAREVSHLGGQATETNGFNCTQGASAFRTPCVTRKAGVLAMRRDAVTPDGRDRPLYLNLTCRSIPKLATARPGDSASVLSGYLRVTRYPASGG